MSDLSSTLSYDKSSIFLHSRNRDLRSPSPFHLSLHKSLHISVVSRIIDDMNEAQELLGDNRPEDVSWLCSLSEAELDMLIDLKRLAIQRAKVIGHEELADKFDLKTLRCLALVIMEYTKGKLEGLSQKIGLSEWNALMDGCNLLKCDSGTALSVEELKACLEVEEKKKPPHSRQCENEELPIFG